MKQIAHSYTASSLFQMSKELNRTFETNPNWKMIDFELAKRDSYYEAMAIFSIENLYSKEDAVSLKGLGTVTVGTGEVKWKK